MFHLGDWLLARWAYEARALHRFSPLSPLTGGS